MVLEMCRLVGPGTLTIVGHPDFQANLRVAQVPCVVKFDRRATGGGTVFAHKPSPLPGLLGALKF